MTTPHVQSTRQDQTRIAEMINSLRAPLEILEAGCGRQWLLNLTVPYRLTGVDTDADAMKARIDEMRDLDVAILGDLRTVDLPPSSFDVIYCCWVLEHVDGAEQVLKSFTKWVKPGGLIVVRVPDRDSLFGWVTRHTPHAFHVWYYRWVAGVKTSGLPGHGPYPTFYDFAISRRGIEEFCEEHGLQLVEVHFVDSWIKKRLIRRVPVLLLAAITLGLLPWRWNNLTFVVRKPA